jgi:choline kinase
VVDERLVRDVITRTPTRATVLIDTSIKNDGDYNAKIIDDKVVVMSNDLVTYDGEYVGITLLDSASAKTLCAEVDDFVAEERYTEWYETALVQMIFEDNFNLYYHDVADNQWTEIDCVDDLFFAKSIHAKSAV